MKRLIERMNRYTPPSIRHGGITSGLLTSVYGMLIKTDKDFNAQMKKALKIYPDQSVSKKELFHDMLNEFVLSWIRPVEYAKFELFHKSREERATYIPDYEEVYIFKRTGGNNILPDSKFERYQIFKDYFLRDVLCISSDNIVSNEEYASFIADKETVVVKPLKGTKGHGISVVNVNEIPTINAFRKLYDGDCLVEETIDQGEELKQFHPSSVNTVRFVTGIDYSGSFHHLFALVRIGRGGSVVDNVSSGGLVTLIDMDKGEICTPACCGTERFETHPDTGVKFNGFRIPQWNELKSLVREIHLSAPGQRMFGFDMAWTRNGWDLVEVNPAPSFDSYQELTGKGIRPYLYELNMLKNGARI